MDLKITWICHLKDEKWGFSGLLNGRELNEETKKEIKDLIEEDIYDAIYSNGTMAIETETGEKQCNLPVVSNNDAKDILSDGKVVVCPYDRNPDNCNRKADTCFECIPI